MADYQAPPEGILLEEYRDLRGYSISKAAERAGGMSSSRWSEIVRGVYRIRDGKPTPDDAPARRIAIMAVAVRCPSRELAGRGKRPDAARLVKEIAAQFAKGRDPIKDAIDDDPLLDKRSKAWLRDAVDSARRTSPSAQYEGNGDEDNGEEAQEA